MVQNVYITLTIAFGFLPPLLWLIFWLREDLHPEPKKELFLVFFAGMAAVALAIFLEKNFFKANFFLKNIFIYGVPAFQLANVFGFALIEEVAKISAFLFTALRSKYFDEPVDAMIYMVTAALGFAALENALFVYDSLLKTGVHQSIIVSSFRFANAVLLHLATAGLLGAGFAFSFFHKERRIKELALAFLLAVLLHAFYNFFIIKASEVSAGESVPVQFVATMLVLIGAAVSLLLFERAKELKNN